MTEERSRAADEHSGQAAQSETATESETATARPGWPRTDSSEDELPEDELPEDELPESELPESELPESELPESELPETAAARAAARARRLAEVFGDVLPEATRDDVPDPAAPSAAGSADERWYAENRPPHHDMP